MNKLIKFLAASAFTMAVMFIFSGINQADAAGYLKIGDIKGESTDNEHKDWIIIQSMSQPAAATSGRQHKPLTIIKELDKASPMLQRASTSGKVFPKVEIHMQTSEYGGSRATYLKYKLQNVMVTSYDVNTSTSTNAAGETRTVQTEMISLSYYSMEKMGERAKKEKPKRETDR